MREVQPGTEMIWAPSTPGRQEGDFCSCLTSKASMNFMCLTRPVGPFCCDQMQCTAPFVPNPAYFFPMGTPPAVLDSETERTPRVEKGAVMLWGLCHSHRCLGQPGQRNLADRRDDSGEGSRAIWQQVAWFVYSKQH